jgi:hypothetical protein
MIHSFQWGMDSRLRGSDGFRTFYAVSRNEAKENAVPRSNLRVIATAGARRTLPALRRAQPSACLFPSAPPMLGAGQREEKPHNVKNSFQAPFKGAASGLTLRGG